MLGIPAMSMSDIDLVWWVWWVGSGNRVTLPPLLTCTVLVRKCNIITCMMHDLFRIKLWSYVYVVSTTLPEQGLRGVVGHPVTTLKH